MRKNVRAVGPEAGPVFPLPCVWVSNAPMFDDSRQVLRKLAGVQVLREGSQFTGQGCFLRVQPRQHFVQ